VAGLTSREREVLDLVADGLTNGEVAQRLWISPGTVRRHLENAYAKLSVRTRTGAVRALSRHIV
jgi:RNA polymerase sigma factor (sigma-70 family)